MQNDRPAVRVVVLAAILSVAALSATVLLAPAIAGAAAWNTTSVNWAGYAIHGHGQRFTRVAGFWTVPQATCARHHPRTYSATWVGIGGYNLSAPALEQIGTETDCRRNGTESSGAWWELVPAPSRGAALAVHTGDLIEGVVTIKGDVVTMILRDFTTHHAFVKRARDTVLDLSSAEWIVEAPSDCGSGSAASCKPLPLTDFGSETFSHAQVRTATGRTGMIRGSIWNVTRILLTGHAPKTASAGRSRAAYAVPSALGGTGGSFSIAFSAHSPPLRSGPPPALSPRADARAS